MKRSYVSWYLRIPQYFCDLIFCGFNKKVSKKSNMNNRHESLNYMYIEDLDVWQQMGLCQ